MWLAMDRVQIREWSNRVDDLLFQCERTSSLPADLLREAHEILTLGPAKVCGSIRPDLSRSSLQFLLDDGAFESAAIRLVRKCSYMLSGTPNGIIIASVALPNSEHDYSHGGTSEAVALCGALATAIQAALSLE
jgi:hypothetical protein